MIVLGCIGVLIVLFCLWRGREMFKEGEAASDTLFKNDKWAVAALFFIALAVRLWQFGIIPYGVNQDEAMAAVDAKALSMYATDRYGMFMPVHFTAWGYGQMSVLLSYAMIPFIKLLGYNLVAIRLPLLLFSMLGLWAVYKVSRLAFGDKIAFFALLICSLNPWHFMQSRWSMDCNLFPHVLWLGIAFMVMGIKKKRYLYISMIFFALCMYCYGVSLYSVPFFLVVMCIYLLRKRLVTIVEVGVSAFIYLLISWPFYLTMAINTFKWETISTPFFTMPFFKDSVRAKDILFFSETPLSQFFANIKSLGMIFVDTKYLNCNYVIGYAPIFLFLLPFALVGLMLLIRMLQKKKVDADMLDAEPVTDRVSGVAKAAVLVSFLMAVWTGILTNNVNVNRINIVFYPVLIFSAIGISYAVSVLKKLSLLMVPIAAFMVVSFFVAYFGRYANDYKVLCYTDFMGAVTYLGSADTDRLVITPDSQYAGAYHVSEIITLFALDIDARYYQNLYSDQHGLYYTDKCIYAKTADVMGYMPEGTGYVTTYDELYLFDEAYYDLYAFNYYIVAVPK